MLADFGIGKGSLEGGKKGKIYGLACCGVQRIFPMKKLKVAKNEGTREGGPLYPEDLKSLEGSIDLAATWPRKAGARKIERSPE